MSQKKRLAGFAAERDGEEGYVVHIVDDAGEVFEIQLTREHVELIRDNLDSLLTDGAAEDKDAKG